jgi:DNA-directed RNA polymerase subunit RPC12/RpoP
MYCSNCESEFDPDVDRKEVQYINIEGNQIEIWLRINCEECGFKYLIKSQGKIIK